jgi:hypothetical protein
MDYLVMGVIPLMCRPIHHFQHSDANDPDKANHENDCECQKDDIWHLPE